MSQLAFQCRVGTYVQYILSSLHKRQCHPVAKRPPSSFFFSSLPSPSRLSLKCQCAVKGLHQRGYWGLLLVQQCLKNFGASCRFPATTLQCSISAYLRVGSVCSLRESMWSRVHTYTSGLFALCTTSHVWTGPPTETSPIPNPIA